MASSAGAHWFGRFMTELGYAIGNDAGLNLSRRLNLSLAETETVVDAENSGLELLSILYDDDVINEEGIDELCTAFRDCQLTDTSLKAERLFNELKSCPIHDYTDGPSDVMINLGKLKVILDEMLKAQDCYELAVYLGLSRKCVQEIKMSNDSATALINMLDNYDIISDSNINALIFALTKLKRKKVADLIKNSEALKSHVCTAQPKKEFVIPNCFCGESSFDELQSESDKSSVVSIRCMKCSSEWFPKTETSDDMSLIWKDIQYSYKIPLELDLLKLKHDTINSISELKRGDHIIFDRAGLYYHHAIYLGDNGGKLDVIHWTTKSGIFTKGNAVSIKRENKSFPCKGLKRVNYDKQDDDTIVVIARAFEMLNNSGKETYCVLEYNCESLASYCKIGKSFSTQGNVLTDTLSPNLLKLINFFGRL